MPGEETQYLSHLLDTAFLNVSRSQACDLIEKALQLKTGFCYVAVKDVALTVRSLEDAFLREFYHTVPRWIFVDGRGLLYSGFFLGTRFKEMVGGPGIYYEMLTRGEAKGHRFFFLGGTQDVLQKAVASVKKRHPQIRIVGQRNGYFDTTDEAEIVEAINNSGCDILFLGISTPKREQFVQRNKSRFGEVVCIAVGGVFDNEAGIAKYAPKAISLIGCEWLYRIFQEPSRLARRYFYTHPRFLLYFIRELLSKRRKASFPSAGSQ